MKTKLLYLLLLIGGFMQAQTIAGSTPAGTHTLNPNVNMSFTTTGTYDSTYFDVNCDNVADFKIKMYKGYTAVDDANYAYLFVLNDTIQMCADTFQYTGNYKRLHYFNLADTLNSPPNASWRADTAYQFGYFGCMFCNGPAIVTNKYFAFKKGTQTYWAEISFNLAASSATPPVTLSIPSVLVSCALTSITSNSSLNNIVIFPNPTNEQFHIETNSSDKLTVDLFDINGRHALNVIVIDKSNINISTLDQGIYTLTIKSSIGVTNKKLVIAR